MKFDYNTIPRMNDKQGEKIILASYLAFGKIFACYALREFVHDRYSSNRKKPGLGVCLKTIEHYFPTEAYVKHRVEKIKLETEKLHDEETQILKL